MLYEVITTFALLFSPGTLEAAPQTFLATAHVESGYEEGLFRAVTGAFANVSAIGTREVLENVSRTLARIGAAFKGMAAVALLSGFLVLAGAVSADRHQRRAVEGLPAAGDRPEHGRRHRPRVPVLPAGQQHRVV